MSDAPTRHPLAWPAGRPRTRYRKLGRFSADGRSITVAVAVSRLDEEAIRLGAMYPLLSTDMPLRLDGRPYSGRAGALPPDPGACLYFQLKGQPFALACDTFTDLAQNIAALAAHIEATRAIERYGVASAAETLQAFSALPPPAAGNRPARPWWEVLGFGADPLPLFPGVAARPAIDAAFREQLKRHHPDAGGSAAAMAEVNAAREEALASLEKTA